MDKEWMSVFLPKWLKEQLREEATEDGRSLNNLVEKILKDHVKKNV